MTIDNPIALSELSQGDRLEGVIRKVTLSGAILDVGAETNGLLHISDLGEKRVTRTSDVLNEGQMVTVWVKRVSEEDNQLSLTMVEPARYGWEALKPGVKTEGKVVALEKFGAFVDIGAETDGLVHISEMSSRRVNKPADVVSVGDSVVVWIKDADPVSRRISLTMVEPPEVDMQSLETGAILRGTVVRLENFGAFVDIGAARHGMIHVTEMGRGYVGSPSEILSVGDAVEVRVLEVDARRGRISLSMKDLPTDEIDYSEEEPEIPSSMELALREAMEQQGVGLPSSSRGRGRRERKSKRAREQEEIIARTLRSRAG